jgi:hypothetical protein
MSTKSWSTPSRARGGGEQAIELGAEAGGVVELAGGGGVEQGVVRGGVPDEVGEPRGELVAV